MIEQQIKTLRAELQPQAINERRALGRGLGGLLLHRRLCAAGRQAHALREEPLPRGMPSWARTWARKVWRKGRKA